MKDSAERALCQVRHNRQKDFHMPAVIDWSQ
jgi:hypothetical protein